MKRFIVSILTMTVFCIGLGAIVENVGARFKSDEKALALVRQARIAIGGDQALGEVRAMIIKGNSTHTFKIGTETRTETGETEIAMQLPDKLSRMVKIGRHDGPAGSEIMNEKHDMIIMRGEGHGEGVGVGTGEGKQRVFVKKIEGAGEGAEIEKVIVSGKDGELTTADGKKVIVRTGGDGKDGEFTTTDGKKVIVRNVETKEVDKVMAGDKLQRFDVRTAHHGERQNDLLRTTLSLLMTAPEGIDVSYTFGGEGDVDGTACNIVNASFGGQTFKLYLSKSSSLPVMVTYQGMPRVIYFKTKAPEGADLSKDVVMFNHKVDAPMPTEFQVRFADYRGVGGVQLPFKWTTTCGGQASEVFDVTGYEINPANIAEKFQNQKVMVRTKKEGS